MSTIKKPILLDETGKEIVSAMRTQNALLSAIARESINSLTSWKDIQALVRQGLAKEIFHIGDQFIVPWKDVEADKTYDVPLDIVHFGDVELQSGEIVPAMFLQWHYATPFGIQFDGSEGEAAAGTVFSTEYSYYVESGKRYDLLIAGIDYEIGEAISTDSSIIRIAIKDVSADIINYGYNRWSHSAIRQFLNSKGEAGTWWVAQHPGDGEADLAHRPGFMTGFEDDFLSVIGPIKVTTALNIVTDEDLGNTEDTYDTFFLPSLEQMYAMPQLAGVEGDYFEYWKRATNSASPNARGQAGKNPGYLTYDLGAKTTPRSVRLRSANRDTSCDTWTVSSSGYIAEINASDNSRDKERCAPVCVVY